MERSLRYACSSQANERNEMSGMSYQSTLYHTINLRPKPPKNHHPLQHGR